MKKTVTCEGLELEIETKVINAPSRKLKAKWTVLSQEEYEIETLKNEIKHIKKERAKRKRRQSTVS